MAKRKGLSKKTRFEVFKRDLFTCQYCGSVPPAVVLQVDHIKPVAAGGTNDVDNLITACFDCNSGKGARELSVAPETVAKKAEMLREKKEQLQAYDRLMKSIRKRQSDMVDMVQYAFQEAYSDKEFSPAFRRSINMFIERTDPYTVESAMFKACAKIPNDATDALKYFCGICWTIIRERKNGQG